MHANATHLLQVDDVCIAIDAALGGRAVSWLVGGHELLTAKGTHPVEHGMYPMAPWAGRIRGNHVRKGDDMHTLPTTYDEWALHGTVMYQPVSVIEYEQQVDSAVLVARALLGLAWPWSGTCTVRWQLTAELLTTQVRVDAGNAPFPAVVGWHPWFRRQLKPGMDASIELHADQMLQRGEDYLPTGTYLDAGLVSAPFDDAFVVPDGVATVRWGDELELQVINSHPWYVRYDLLPEAFCVEPQSGPPNGLADLPGVPATWVRPGEPLVMTTTWRMGR